MLCRPADLSPGSDERQFVISAWSSSYKGSHFSGLITSEDWPTIMHVQIGKIIDRPATRTLVAAGPQDFIYGFISGDPAARVPIVHYCYVKDAFRSRDEGQGQRSGPRIARALFAALGVDPARSFLFTCRTADVAQLEGRRDHAEPRLPSKIPGGRFVPAAARYVHYTGRER